jgi:uroporphyrin-III C-methyltransferase / precorrin-2 dehydrogenase / sirohydrochlorin ferrochelatase
MIFSSKPSKSANAGSIPLTKSAARCAPAPIAVHASRIFAPFSMKQLDKKMAPTDRSPAELPFVPSITTNPPPRRGGVILVGAGPGDPELLTVKAVRALQSADVILADDLVSSEIVEFARREARTMLVGKTGHAPSCKQDDVSALMVKLAKSGKTVVRLKGGDPMIFARAGEEIAACRAVGIPVEVIPGISAAQGAASSIGVALTERETARRIQFVTGHGADGKLPADFDFASVGDGGTTTALFMPVKTLGVLAATAMAHGIDPFMPAIAVSRASRTDEKIIAGTIGDIAFRLNAANVPGPVIVLVGRVLLGYVARQEQMCEREHALAQLGE